MFIEVTERPRPVNSNMGIIVNINNIQCVIEQDYGCDIKMGTMRLEVSDTYESVIEKINNRTFKVERSKNK